MGISAAVGHLDADCFYVSAERARSAFLLDKPVGVLGNQGVCVIAKSREMKNQGVGTGMPIWEALPRCPDGVYLKRDFRWYETLSRRMLDLVRDLSYRVEYYSIDEFFFVATPRRGQTYEDLARSIRDRIWEAARVPVTVAIARTRTLAKLLGDVSKPFGARAVVDAEGEAALLAERSVADITGIAGRRETRLTAWNIRTCLDLAEADRRLVRRLLTATGEALWWELRGEPVTPIRPHRPLHKALSRGGSLGESTAEPVVLFAWLVRNLERLIEELEYHEVLAGTLTVWVSYRNGQSGVGRANLAVPTDRFDPLLDVARSCLRRAWVPRVAAMRMHLIAEHLVPRADAQLALFEPSDGRAEALAHLKRSINQRHGRFAIRSGATLPLDAVYRDEASSYDICDVRGKTCF